MGVPLHILGHSLFALVDGEAGENFIAATLAKRLALTCSPLSRPTTVRVANGQFLECVSSVYVRVFMASLRLRLRFLVASVTPLTLVAPFLRCFDPYISRRDVDLTLRRGQCPRMVPMYAAGDLTSPSYVTTLPFAEISALKCADLPLAFPYNVQRAYHAGIPAVLEPTHVPPAVL